MREKRSNNKAIAPQLRAREEVMGFNDHAQKAIEYYQQLINDRLYPQIAVEYKLPA